MTALGDIYISFETQTNKELDLSTRMSKYWTCKDSTPKYQEVPQSTQECLKTSRNNLKCKAP